MNNLVGARLLITGIVQGVGFRPFVYSLATRLGLAGWVRNTSAGVDIEVDGTAQAVQTFVKALQESPPPLARIDSITTTARVPNGYSEFRIIHSEPIPGAFQPISPDVSICEDCFNELFDPGDRRYLYPFINCTNCGPRFTIIEDIPYDRPKTTMSSFEMCSDCSTEYNNPLDRRFHAQPVACPVCGPHVWLEYSTRNSTTADKSTSETITGNDALSATIHLLSEGKIVAIKGIGGFHLACDANNIDAVVELRRRKLRVDKPFALMMPNIATVKTHCFVKEAESELLQSRERPVVILDRRPDSSIAEAAAPNQQTLGVMLPYTPLHYLLFVPQPSHWIDRVYNIEDLKSSALIMTSGNLSEEPIATDNEEARQNLADIADAFLMHNRPIRTRCDDSVVRVFHSVNIPQKTIDPSHTNNQQSTQNLKQASVMFIRRSRGYAPSPIQLPWDTCPILATGPELKNTFCITRGQYAFLSHHIGDMENFETLQSFEDGVAHFERLFRILPQIIAYDLHPNYLASRYAIERAKQEDLPAIGVQHHHAHIASCMVENGIPGDKPVIGVSFDGTGYGEDGAIWGGEFLLAGYRDYRRLAYLKYSPLPGGDASIKKPARTALAHLWAIGIEWDPDLLPVNSLSQEERNVLNAQLEHNLNCTHTSSMGRLFDAVAALVGIRQVVNYEAQAAIELETVVDPNENGLYHIPTLYDADQLGSFPIQIDTAPLIHAIITDLYADVPVPVISARFHNSIAEMVHRVTMAIRSFLGISEVVLSGGVWQNTILLNNTVTLLNKSNFAVYTHHQVPTNDGGLSIGQAAICYNKLISTG